jgi:hypothetical protein
MTPFAESFLGRARTEFPELTDDALARLARDCTSVAVVSLYPATAGGGLDFYHDRQDGFAAPLWKKMRADLVANFPPVGPEGSE